MIRETSMFSSGNQSLSVTMSTQQDSETKEKEISRLTWAVLDGRASKEDRERLSQLVNSQHQQRAF